MVNPEAEMGLRLARQLSQPNVLDRFDLGKNAEVAEIAAPEAFVGKNLVELNLRREFGISVVALRRQGAIRASLEVTEPFESGDALVIVGSPTAVRRVAALA